MHLKYIQEDTYIKTENNPLGKIILFSCESKQEIKKKTKN